MEAGGSISILQTEGSGFREAEAVRQVAGPGVRARLAPLPICLHFRGRASPGLSDVFARDAAPFVKLCVIYLASSVLRGMLGVLPSGGPGDEGTRRASCLAGDRVSTFLSNHETPRPRPAAKVSQGAPRGLPKAWLQPLGMPRGRQEQPDLLPRRRHGRDSLSSLRRDSQCVLNLLEGPGRGRWSAGDGGGPPPRPGVAGHP